ncbi:MAG: hypothetical protein U1F71_00755 [Verrucomicrobiaceae bacterium]
MMRVLPPASLLVIPALVFCSCSMLRKITPDVHIPMPHLPSMNTVAKVIPGMPESDKVNADDPDVPFDSRGTLGNGHTLRIEVYEGTLGTKRIYRDISMVDAEGLLPLGKVGTARVGGLHLPQAVEAITAVFRVAGRNTRPITVHLISVENTPLLDINGDVRDPGYIPIFNRITVQDAVTARGGRKAGSTTRGVYISHHGQRRFFPSIEAADRQWDPGEGDIITLSPDI